MTDTEENAYEEAAEEFERAVDDYCQRTYPAPDEQAPDEQPAFPDNGAEFFQEQEYVDLPEEAWESHAPPTESCEGLHEWTEDELNLL